MITSTGLVIREIEQPGGTTTYTVVDRDIANVDYWIEDNWGDADNTEVSDEELARWLREVGEELPAVPVLPANLIFINRDERYGDAVPGTLEQYQTLNPDGQFDARADGLYEKVGGRWTMIADAIDRPTDGQLVEAWMRQSPPRSLTEDDVTYARMAENVMSNYFNHGSDFELDEVIGYLADVHKSYNALLGQVKRGFAVLAGFLLVRGDRQSTWNGFDVPQEAVIWKIYPAGYKATAEQHQLYYLVKPGDLITVTEAANRVFGSSEQKHIVRMSQFIRDGRVQVFIDRAERNSQRNKRLSAIEVDRLRKWYYA
jgi:hypothetical protein